VGDRRRPPTSLAKPQGRKPVRCRQRPRLGPQSRGRRRGKKPQESRRSLVPAGTKLPSAQWTRRFRRIARLRRPARGLARLHAHTLARAGGWVSRLTRSREQVGGGAPTFKVKGVGFAAERRRGPAWKRAGGCRRDRSGSSCSGSDLTRRGGSQDPLRRPLHVRSLCAASWRRGPSGLRTHVCRRGCRGWRGCPGPSPHGFGRCRVGRRAPSGRR
jgi:hypothetical protein